MKKHMIDIHAFKWGRNVVPMNEVLWANLICQLVDADEQEREEYCHFARSKLKAEFKSQGNININFNQDLTLEVEKEGGNVNHTRDQIVDMILVSHKIRCQIYERTSLYTKEEGKEDFRTKTKDLDRYLFPLMGMTLNESPEVFRVVYVDIQDWGLLRTHTISDKTDFWRLYRSNHHRFGGVCSQSRQDIALMMVA